MLLLLLSVEGLRMNLLTMTLIACGWLFVCFAPTGMSRRLLSLTRSNERKMILEEEVKMAKLLGEIVRRAGYDKPVQVLIEETMAFNAYAKGGTTIVISRGLLENFSDGEIRGVLAHELGHLVSGDDLVRAAFMVASALPVLVKFLMVRIWRSGLARLLFTRRRLPFIICGMILLAALGLFTHGQILNACFTTGLLALFWYVDRPFILLLLILSRYTEYRQDDFASGLGYGKGLRNALVKITLSEIQHVNLCSILRNNTHPVIYNRIRRLERLEGIR